MAAAEMIDMQLHLQAVAAPPRLCIKKPPNASPAIHMDIVQLLAKAEAQHLTHQIASLNSLHPHESFTTHHVPGSLTIQAPAKYGSKLNHTINLGLSGSVTKINLDEIEKAFEGSGIWPRIDLNERAHPSAVEVLEDAGYGPDDGAKIETFYRLLDSEIVVSDSDGLTVSETNDTETFVRLSNAGFASGGRPPGLLRLLARSAASRSDTRLFVAFLAEELVGSAAVAMFTVDGMKVANLYIDSTLPSARGKGVHRVLLEKRLQVASEDGCEMAICGARAGSASARNIERVGFVKGSGCVSWVKEL